jgi:hypothetical protein
MKTKLLIAGLFIGLLNVNAQTTHNLNWFTGIGSDVDLTIVSGDTVIWTWTNPNHTVESVEGSSVESFDSGFLADTGSTFEYTFTVVGDNDYFCGVHGVNSMSGTITVDENLSIEDENLNTFKIKSNPVNQNLELNFSQNLLEGKLLILDLLGKSVISSTVNNSSSALIDVSSLKSGLYIVKISAENSTQSKRFIKN